jgi:hypothetical protein
MLNMYFLRKYRYALMFLLVLSFCSVMVTHQINLNEDRRIERREAFILLHSRGYTNEAARLFNKMVAEVPNLSHKQLINDFQRTVILVDPSIENKGNLIWKYHWYVSNEMERRSVSALRDALKLAGQGTN